MEQVATDVQNFVVGSVGTEEGELLIFVFIIFLELQGCSMLLEFDASFS